MAMGFLLCWPLVDATREAVRRDGGGAVCLSPRHVWGIPAPIVAFEVRAARRPLCVCCPMSRRARARAYGAAQDVGVAWPRIVSGSGKVRGARRGHAP